MQYLNKVHKNHNTHTKTSQTSPGFTVQTVLQLNHNTLSAL